jgi:hypothetical protein
VGVNFAFTAPRKHARRTGHKVNQRSRSERPVISVVVASVDAARSIEECLQALDIALEGTEAEVIVVDASADGTAELLARSNCQGTLIRYPAGVLTPDLWAEGIRRSRGKTVALTTGHCLVPRDWARALVATVDDTVVGAAGALELANGTGPVDWAVYYLRYSEFISYVGRNRDGAMTIPADNAAYDGDAVRAYTHTTAEGFWEVDFHRGALAGGKTLAFVAAATARFGRSFPFTTIAAHRFAHGRHSGSWRVRTGASSVARSVLAAPLVPLILTVRTARRVLRGKGHRSRFLGSLPIFLVLAASWAAGEAWGAIAGPDLRSFRPLEA